ncbi:MAG: rhodanese-like domain-containing protein [Dehalococcoidia bacterium]
MGLFDFFRRNKRPVASDVAPTLAVDPPFEDVTPAEASALQASGALILDVRSRGEYAGGHIAGAQNVPVDEIRRDVAKIPEAERIVFVCEMGGRSAYAAALAAASGRQNLANLDGGMQAWRDAGMPIEER